MGTGTAGTTRATLIAVGTELVSLGRRDTNSDWLAERLALAGIEVETIQRVADDVELQAAAFRAALQRGGLAITTGGLGPTEDDRTREALALAAGVPLERDPERLERIRSLFEARGIPFGAGQARQADRPHGAAWIDNPLGSAPGLDLRTGSARLFALPGVPAEMKAMFAAHVAPALEGGAAVHHRVVRIASRGEGAVDELLRDLYAGPDLRVTILAHPGLLELHLRVPALDGGPERVAEIERQVRERLGDAVYGGAEVTLAGEVGRLLLERGETAGTAESCTAGLVAAALTEVPGASAWFRGGVIVYDDSLKRTLAGVREETLVAHGAVSAEVARELARGCRRSVDADWGVGITGIAGPGGGTDEKPVGTVHIAVSGPRGEHHRRHLFHGDRGQVRARAVNAALDALRRRVGR